MVPHERRRAGWLGIFAAVLNCALAKEVFDLGACFDSDPDMGAMYVMAKVALDEGYFDDVLPLGGRSTNFTVTLKPVESGCNALVASRVAMPLLMGQGAKQGRIYDDFITQEPVIAIAGCVCSSASMAVSSLATNYKVPMVSAYSQHRSLSDKMLHPYFSRVVPPNSLEGVGLAKLVIYFEWTRVMLAYVAEDFALGAASAIRVGLDAYAGARTVLALEYQFRFQQLNFPELAPKFNRSIWLSEAIRMTKETPQPRIFMVLGNQIDHLLRIFYDLGLVSTSTVYFTNSGLCQVHQLQTVGRRQTEYASRSNYDPWFVDFDWMTLPAKFKGLLCMRPQSLGPKFSSARFGAFFANVTRAKLDANGWYSSAATKYWDDAWLNSTRFGGRDLCTLAFDAVAVIIYALGTLMGRGIRGVNATGATLLREIRATDYEGVSGAIVFNQDGDRLAPYNLMNLRVDATGMAAMKQIGVYNSGTGNMTFSELPVFADGTTNVPLDRPAPCPAGEEYLGGTACVKCLPGFARGSADSQRCTPCQLGNYQNRPGMSTCILAIAGGFVNTTGATQATLCLPGNFAAEKGLTACDPCFAGFHQSLVGATDCDRCPRATFANDTGRALCTSCPTGQTTDGTGLTSPRDCGCPPSTYPSVARDACLACGEGMTCNGFGAPTVAAPGYQLAACDDELCVFRCWRDHRRCPGGELSRCAAGRTGVACGECEAGKVEVDKGEFAGTCQDCEDEDFSALPLALIFTGLILVAYYLGSRRTQAVQTTSVIVLVTTVSQVANVLQTLSAVSRLSIEWVEPARSMVRLFSVLAFDIEWIHWGCLGALNIMDRYILRIVVAPCCIAWITLVHFLVSIIVRLMQARVKKYLASDTSTSALQNSIGGFIMVLLVAITSTSLLPFKCQQSPNGKWTMTEYDSQICWHGETHAGLIVLASIGLLVPSGFFVYIVYIIRASTAKIASGNATFLRAHAFLFARVRPQRLWFALFIVSRNLCIATFPAVPDAFWQVFLEQWTILLYTTAVLQARPWRLPLNNSLDICFGVLFLLILMCASSNLPEGSVDPQELARLVAIIIVMLLVIVAVLLVAALSKLATPRRRRFACFICHQKQSAGALARLLNLHLEDALQREVFLDADHLSRLDTLFGFVRNDTDTLVVLLTSRLLHSPWCLGEVTTASMYGVKTLPVYLQGFDPPSVQWVGTIQEVVNLTVLAENAISASDVREAVKNLMMLDHVKPTERVCARMVKGLVEAIASRRTQAGASFLAETVLSWKSLGNVTNFVGHPASRSRPVGRQQSMSMPNDDFVCMAIADGCNPESMSSALILIHMMHKLQQVELRKVVPELLDFGSDSPDLIMQWAKEERKLVVFICLTHGCFRSAEFMFGLMCSSVLNLALALPVVMPDDFHYPTEETYLVLEKDVTSLCTSKRVPDASAMVSTFVKSIFINIAARLSVQSDKNTLSTQVMNILSRVPTGFGTHAGSKPGSELREGILTAFLQEGREVLDAHSETDSDESSIKAV